MKKFILKLNKKLIPGMLSLIAITLVLVIAFAAYFNRTLGWFSINSTLTSKDMQVTISNLSYDIAVAGDNIGAISYTEQNGSYVATPVNDFLTAINAPDGTSGTYTTTLSSVPGTYYITGNSSDPIKWRLTSPTYDPTDPGIGPGSSGDFTFYILPRTSEDLHVTLSLYIEGYSATVNKNENYTYEVGSDLAKIEPGEPEYSAVTYLNTHILFFTGKTGDYFTGLIDDKLELSFTNCTPNVLIPVTLYWTWPNTFSQYICIAGGGNVADTSNGASQASTETVAALRQYVIDNSTDILKDLTEQQIMDYLATQEQDLSYTFNQTLATTNISDLSLGYNRADQEIGTTVHYFLLTLSSERG